jgi:polyhydroxyalkanoate synthase
VLSVLGRAAGRPDEVRGAWLRFATAMAEAWPAAVGHWLGEDGEPPLPVDDRDKRFADPAWDGNPGYFALRQAYLAARRLGEDLLAAGQGDRVTDQKARLAVALAFDALAPTNFLPTNPAALKRAYDTAGASLLAGASNSSTTSCAQRRTAAPGRHVAVRAGPQPRGHPGKGGVPQ